MSSPEIASQRERYAGAHDPLGSRQLTAALHRIAVTRSASTASVVIVVHGIPCRGHAHGMSQRHPTPTRAVLVGGHTARNTHAMGSCPKTVKAEESSTSCKFWPLWMPNSRTAGPAPRS